MQGISQTIASQVVNGSDISFNQNGDITIETGNDYLYQRIYRRLITIPGSYIQHPTYGAGIPNYIGQITDDQIDKTIKANIINQIFQEEAVSKTPEPTIEFRSEVYKIFIQITLTFVGQQTPLVLNYTFTN